MQLALVLDVGRSDDPEALPGLAHAAVHTWLAGRTLGVRRSDTLGGLGSLGFDVGTDLTTITLATPRVLLPEALAALASVFSEDARHELPAALAEAVRGLEVEWLRDEDHGAGGDIAYLFPALFGPTHPYARARESSPLAYGNLDAASLAAFYAAHWRTENATLHVSGDIAYADAVAAAEAALPAAGGPRTCPSFTAAELDPPVMTPRTAVVTHTARVPERRLHVAWTLPAGLGRQDFLLEVLPAVLELQVEGVGCRTEALRDAAVLWCEVPLQAQAKPMAEADLLLGAVEALGPRVGLPASSLRGDVFDWLDGPRAASGSAYVLTHAHRNAGVDPRLDALKTLAGLDPTAVRGFIGAWLTRARAVVGVVEPALVAAPAPAPVAGPPSLPEPAPPPPAWTERMLAADAAPLRSEERVFASGARAVAVSVPGAVTTAMYVLTRRGDLAGARPLLASIVAAVIRGGSSTTAGAPGSVWWMAWKRMEGTRRTEADPARGAEEYREGERAWLLDPPVAAESLAIEMLVADNPWMVASWSRFQKAQKASSGEWWGVMNGVHQPQNTVLLVVGGLEPGPMLDKVEANFSTWPIRKAPVPTPAWTRLPEPAPAKHATILTGSGASAAQVLLACPLAPGVPDALIEELQEGVAGRRLADVAGLGEPPLVTVRASPLHDGILVVEQSTTGGSAARSAGGLMRWLEALLATTDTDLVRSAAAQAHARRVLARASVAGTADVVGQALLRPGGLGQIEADRLALRTATPGMLRERVAPCAARLELVVVGGDDGTEAAIRELGIDVSRVPFTEWLQAKAPQP